MSLEKEYRRQYRKEWRLKTILAGKCVDCGGNRNNSSTQRCDDCKKKSIAYANSFKGKHVTVLTQKQKEEILRLKSENKSGADIARQLKIKPSAVYYWLTQIAKNGTKQTEPASSPQNQDFARLKAENLKLKSMLIDLLMMRNA